MPGITRKGGRNQRSRRNKKIRSRKGRQSSRRIGGGITYKFNEAAFNDDSEYLAALDDLIYSMFTPISNSTSKVYGHVKLDDGAGLRSPPTLFVLGTTNATGFVDFKLDENTGKITYTFKPDDETNDWKFKGKKFNKDTETIKEFLENQENGFIIKVSA